LVFENKDLVSGVDYMVYVSEFEDDSILFRIGFISLSPTIVNF
jgi:hypothetical protein